MGAYKAFVLRENNGVVSGCVEMANRRDLPANQVLIKVKYSSLNYTDALILSGDKAYWKRPGIAPGMDVAGVVAESNVSEYKKGDEVIVTGCGLGTDIPGGFGQYVSVPAEWVITRPLGLSLQDAVTIGTDGLASAIAVMEIYSGAPVTKGERAVVSGASFGAGAFAAGVLAKCGYSVTAVVGNDASEDFVKSLGVSEIIIADKFIDNTHAPMLADKYALAIDTQGGAVLSTMIKSLRKGGSVAVCGMCGQHEFSTSIEPLIMRGINIVGIDAVNCSTKLKYAAWYKMTDDWFIKALPMLSTEIALTELVEYSERILKNEIKGRVIINHDL